MKEQEIIGLVSSVLSVSYSEMISTQRREAVEAMDICITLMIEEDITPLRIALCFDLHPKTVYYKKRVIDALLRFDKTFKMKYLSCIKRLAELEEAI